tara:strand:+ start:172 stop:522 length:351 start_codon:yes stop_codon:yes gene_type:complete
MAFKFKYPNSTTIIGYIESANLRKPTKHSGDRATAKIFVPENPRGNKNNKYPPHPLRVTVIGFGKIANKLMEYSVSGDLVVILGNLIELRSGGTETAIYIQSLTSLDDDEGAEDVY